jgi:hypothetical protein
MTISEIVMEDNELDDHFERLMSEGSLRAEGTAEENELDWWVGSFPTLQSAEEELLRLRKQQSNLKCEDYAGWNDYLADIVALDHDIMLMEMTIDAHYKDWIPEGSKLSDFNVGVIFRTGGGRWLCTDVGSRTVIAIRYTPSNPEKMDGPPYVGVESVFDEYDLGGITILSK